MAQKKEYAPSAEVRSAQSAVEAQKNARPEEYRSGWEDQLRALMGQILDQKEFRYDLDGDALYRQYRDRAMRDGKLAMQDTVGQIAALTGGYGNSYAETAGQQAYWKQLEGLSDRIPELYALALDQYRQRADGLRQKYDLLAGAEDRDYSRYRDSLSAWQKEADTLWKQYTNSRDFDYSVYRDRAADDQWQQNFDESKRRYDQEWAEKTRVPEKVYISSGGSAAKQTKQTEQTAQTEQTPKTGLSVFKLPAMAADKIRSLATKKVTL